MSKARMQPQTQTGIVWKFSIAIFFLLAFVLYKTNEYFRQEKWQIAKTQLRTQVITTKTSVSSQLVTLKNVLSSYEYGLNEAQINWVSLDPFFAIASAQMTGPKTAPSYKILKIVGRSGSVAERWTPQYLEKALSARVISAEQPIGAQLFQDRAGGSFLSLRFNTASGKVLIVVGRADFFQKYFDVTRGGRSTMILQTTENLIAGHSEAEYVGSLFEEQKVSWKKYLVEREEIAGTNLVLLNFVGRMALVKGLAIPWSIVGLIVGFGLLLVGIIMYTTDPLERRIEKFKKQEREQVYKDTLAEQSKLMAEPQIKFTPSGPKPTQPPVIANPVVVNSVTDQPTPTNSDVAKPAQTATDIVRAKIDKALEEMSRPENLSLKSRVSTAFENEDQGLKLDDVGYKMNAEPEVKKEVLDDSPDGFSMMTPSKNPTEPIIVSPPSGSVVIDDDNYEAPNDDFSINKIMMPVSLEEPVKVTETVQEAVFEPDANQSPAAIRDSFLKKLSEEQFPQILSDSVTDPSEDTILKPLSDSAETVIRTEFNPEKTDELVKFDIDKALSIDDLDVEKIAERFQPKNVVTESTLFGLQKPQVNLKKKSYKVDAIQVAIRRPEKS